MTLASKPRAVKAVQLVWHHFFAFNYCAAVVRVKGYVMIEP